MTSLTVARRAKEEVVRVGDRYVKLQANGAVTVQDPKQHRIVTIATSRAGVLAMIDALKVVAEKMS